MKMGRDMKAIGKTICKMAKAQKNLKMAPDTTVYSKMA